ncbi:MAG: hypothetical protein FJ109_13920, partial [Deltaproteobacteria bacterium]|nr:hypothetical protein [Deltaproteobacteria bacterium]
MRVAIPVRASAWFLVAAALPALSGCAEDSGELPCVPYTSRCGEVEDTLEVCDPSGTGWSLAMLCTGGCQDGLCAGMIGPELGDKNPLWGRPPDNDFYNSDPEPPQAPGFDLPGVRVGLPEPGYKDIGETLGYPVGVVVSKGGVLQMNPGDWLEPKDGRCQRLIYKGPFFEI